MRACARACVRACVRAFIRACMHACIHACMHACMFFPNSGSYRVLMGFQKDFQIPAGTGQAISPKKTPEDDFRHLRQSHI